MLDGGFWIGMHNVAHCRYFDRTFVSANQLRTRTTGFAVGGAWIMDSGAFTEVTTHGGYRSTPEAYAGEVVRWAMTRTLRAAVSQDYMCEDFVLQKTGLSVADHQRLTTLRYDALATELGRRHCATTILPVLQGYAPSEYVTHIAAYGPRLTSGMWVGVGSVCKRNADPGAVYAVLAGIKRVRPDLRLHGFGLKTTALSDPRVLDLLYSADSMAWSFAARKDALPLLLSLREELGRKVGPSEARRIYAARGVRMPNANGLSDAREFWRKVNEIIARTSEGNLS